MKLSSKDLLKRLGRGEPISVVAGAAGPTRDEFDVWWRAETAARVPPATGTRRLAEGVQAEISRDAWGVPHVFAATDEHLFFAFGYAMAQDRLFQLDYLRRKGAGTLAEVLGPEGLPLDTIARTVGFRRIAEGQWERTPEETRALLTAFSGGVNTLIG
jgi:penicillin G amidase